MLMPDRKEKSIHTYRPVTRVMMRAKHEMEDPSPPVVAIDSVTVLDSLKELYTDRSLENPCEREAERTRSFSLAAALEVSEQSQRPLGLNELS